MKKSRVNKNYFLSLFAAVAVALFLFTPPAAAALTAKSLANDLSYYRRISKEKNLDANGRNYVLSRIDKKYHNSRVDLSPLRAEQRKLSSPAAAAVPEQDEQPAATTRTAPSGTVDKIIISDTSKESRVTVIARNVRRSNYFLLRDPSPGQAPKIVLDLYDADDRLSAKAKDVALRNGLFSRVHAGQFEDKPNRIVRITAQLRQDVPYRVVREPGRWIIIADKNARPIVPPAVTIPTPAPAPAAAPIVNTAGAPAPTVEEDKDAATDTSSSTPAVKTGNVTAVSQPALPSLPNGTSDFYRIETGDILGITVFPADELSRESVVQFDGMVVFPLVGTVKASGLTPKQLEDSLENSLSRYLAGPQVTITIKQFSRRQVFVTGEVRSVGAYNYRDNLRLMEFISSLGGFTENANRREVKVYRGTGDKRKVFTNNMEDVIRSGDFSKDFILEPGDIVEVPQGRARVAVLGDVRSPGYYDYRDNLNLLELISLAGGFTDSAAINKVSILHDSGGKEGKKVSIINLKEILDGKSKDVPVGSGETVYVPKKNLASANWFIGNVLPWLSLISLVLVIRGGV